jgi:hypothetical protein
VNDSESPNPGTEAAAYGDESEDGRRNGEAQYLARSQPYRPWLKSLSARLTEDRDACLQRSLQYPLDCEYLVRAAAKLTGARDLIDDLLPVGKRRKSE